MPARVVSFAGMVASPRVKPTAVANAKIASLFNKVGSGVLVAIRDFRVTLDNTDPSTSLRNLATSRITTAPADGTLHTPMSFDTAKTHNANVEFRSGGSADGVSSVLTADAGPHAWRQFHLRYQTEVEQASIPADPMLPQFIRLDPEVLREGEGVVVQVVDAASVSTSIVINAVFEEFTYASGDPDVLAVSPSTLDFAWTI